MYEILETSIVSTSVVESNLKSPVVESIAILYMFPSTALTIYCEVSEKPQHWSDYWNYRGQNDEIFVYWESDKY